MKKSDFSGYATKNGIKCSDKRIIVKDAFKHNDGDVVPLVWQHFHSDPGNILGHAVLENRETGVYAYGYFNDTEAGQNAKTLVKHGDITALSIYANNLQQQGNSVIHGSIREVSLVLSGANPGALIDNISFAHSDGSYEEDDSEAVIYTGLSLSIDPVKHADISSEEKTVQEVFDTLNEDQKTVVYAMLSQAVGEVAHSNLEGEPIMKKNLFDSSDDIVEGKVLSHDQIKSVFEDAKKTGSFKDSFLSHAKDWGIENLEILFPDAQAIRNTPDLVKRDDSWVAGVMAETNHSPFSRIKSMSADITEDEARAKGYITGNKKKEAIFPIMKRVTTPTTVYKKQKMDRDDIIDITGLDVVLWIKNIMRVMLNEELARQILIGDGRAVDDPDKINPENIRPIWTDDDFYSYKLELPENIKTLDLIDSIVRARKNYKGSGSPALYTTTDILTDMLLVRDDLGRKIYPTMQELTAALRVSKIVEVEVLEDKKRTTYGKVHSLIGILVNLRDYTIGADKGGEVAMFDDFDIDYNQYKYLIETRCSGALTLWNSAIVIEKVGSDTPFDVPVG